VHIYSDTGDYNVELTVYGQVNTDNAFGEVHVLIAEPLILSIKDVEEDQGGRVLVKWRCSGYDGPVNSTITDYTVWEEIDDTWTALGTVGSRQEDTYSYLATTVKDSSTEGTNWTYFRVTAHSGDAQIFYDSEVDSGYSVDNLAPEAPQNLMASQTQTVIQLTWDESRSYDFDYFIVFRDDEAIGNTVDPEYEDSDVELGITYTYKLQAADFHGNNSEFSESLEVTFEPSAISTENVVIPIKDELFQNFPNPFNPSTTIRYILCANSDVKLKIYDLSGKEIRTLVNNVQAAGKYSVVWDGKDGSGLTVSSGIYLYKIQMEGYLKSFKMLFIK